MEKELQLQLEREKEKKVVEMEDHLVPWHDHIPAVPQLNAPRTNVPITGIEYLGLSNTYQYSPHGKLLWAIENWKINRKDRTYRPIGWYFLHEPLIKPEGAKILTYVPDSGWHYTTRRPKIYDNEG